MFVSPVPLPLSANPFLSPSTPIKRKPLPTFPSPVSGLPDDFNPFAHAFGLGLVEDGPVDDDDDAFAVFISELVDDDDDAFLRSDPVYDNTFPFPPLGIEGSSTPLHTPPTSKHTAKASRKRVYREDAEYSTPNKGKKRREGPETRRKVAAGALNILVTSPGSVPTPSASPMKDPRTYLPKGFIEVARTDDGEAAITCPAKWEGLGPCIYYWVTESGDLLVGKTVDMESRLASYQSAFNGVGDAAHLPLPTLWREGQRVFVGVRPCTDEMTMDQNETSQIVGKATLNQNVGNGDPSIWWGSPRHGGTIPKKVRDRHTSTTHHHSLPAVTDIRTLTPKKTFDVQYDEEHDEFFMEVPKRFGELPYDGIVYRFKDADGHELIGETGNPLLRLRAYMSRLNTGRGGRLNLSILEGLQFNFGLLVATSRENKRAAEGQLQREREANLNVRREKGIPRSPLRDVTQLPLSPSTPSKMVRVPSRRRKKAVRKLSLERCSDDKENKQEGLPSFSIPSHLPKPHPSGFPRDVVFG